MSELGELLKKARLDKNISLDELQELTKIQKRYLIAIETGDFNALPGHFYVKAFIKSYADSVGVDRDHVMQLYQNDVPTAANPGPNVRNIRRKKRSFISTEKLTKWAAVFLVICFIGLIFAIIYYFLISEDKDQNLLDENPALTSKLEDELAGSQNNPDSPIVDIQDPEPEPEPVPEPPPEPEVTLVTSEGDTNTYTVSNSEKLQVEIKILNRIWMQVKKNNIDGEEIHQQLFETNQINEIFPIESQDSLWIRLGNANNAEITVNGTVIEQDIANPWNFQINLKKFDENLEENPESAAESTDESAKEENINE
ncbi:helix-turn-helix domain-containing protein [Chengkuizengella axinellae]|uniref:Helix-turn-helix domain-containing protein n=1 Tax=Chengkuizengella axinellae TaxID=3064388 RepID=A0ABT9IXI0_9BACL|nr:helix-turn-helix domain-containing protein [Chengkuizengella sp. 2205SS18-9]MDP5273509.1 helix-turn-helix domain-containing protein [Chengkuizengella sp. 2205SS18-9]